MPDDQGRKTLRAPSPETFFETARMVQIGALFRSKLPTVFPWFGVLLFSNHYVIVTVILAPLLCVLSDFQLVSMPRRRKCNLCLDLKHSRTGFLSINKVFIFLFFFQPYACLYMIWWVEYYVEIAGRGMPENDTVFYLATETAAAVNAAHEWFSQRNLRLVLLDDMFPVRWEMSFCVRVIVVLDYFTTEIIWALCSLENYFGKQIWWDLAYKLGLDIRISHGWIDRVRKYMIRFMKHIYTMQLVEQKWYCR